MPVPNSVIPDSLQGEYFNDPILPIPEQETGVFDLLSTGDYSGAEVSVNTLENKLSEFAGAPTSIETLSAPRFFDYDATQADRYKQSSNFTSIGFNPTIGTENEYRYGARQTWGDVWSNGLAGMFSLAGNTYVEGWKGWGHLVDAIAAQDFSKIVGSEEELLAQDKTTKDILNKYAIFSTPESEEGLFNRKFFGDMLQQSGFAVGAISQFLTEELITWGLSTEFSLAKLGLKSSAWAGRVVSHADVAEDLVKLGNPVWKSKSFTEGAVQSARQFIPLANTAYTMSKYGKAGAGALQLASIGVGGVRRLLSEVNMAMTEARMESAGTYGELYNKLFDESLRYTGQAPIGSELESIKKNAMDAAYDNFNVNTGILMLSNRLQFNNLFGRFTAGRAFFGATGEFADDVLKVTGRSVASEAGEKTMKAYTKGKLGTFGLLGEISRDFGKRTAAWEATKSLGRNIFKWETTEGLQELFQEGSNKGLTDYYYSLYHGSKGYDSKMESIMNGIDNPFTNIQGTKTFLMGALTGRLLSPINFAVGKTKYYAGTSGLERAERKAKVEEAVSLVNAFYEKPSLFLNEHIANVKVQDRAAKNMEEAIRNRDKYEFVNNKDGAFAKMMSAAIKTDMHKAVINTIREYGDSFSDDEFKQAFGLDKNQENISSVKEYFNKVANETEDFHKTWKQLKDKFGDAVMVDLYKEGTPERKTALRAKRALDDAIEILATNNYKATRSAQRAVKIQTDVASIPGIGNSVATAFRNLGVIQNTEKEIELLENEIRNLEAQEEKDKTTKDLIKSKKNQLKSLNNWKENHETLKLKGIKQKRKFKKALTAFQNYVVSKNQESGITQEVKLDDVQDIYEQLIDYIELNKDSKDYIDAYNTLANPIKFVQVHKRLLEAMDAAAEKLNQEHIQEAISAMTQKKSTPPDEKGEEVPDFTKYMQDAYESMKSAGQTDLSFDKWVNSPNGKTFTQLYNKKYNKAESLAQEAKDRKAGLEVIKKDVLAAQTLTTDIMEDVFTRLSNVLGVSIADVENAYFAYQDTLKPEEVKQALLDMGAKEGMPAEEAATMISKYLLPKFIDNLIATNGLSKQEQQQINPADNLDVIELPTRKVKMSKPKLNKGETLIDDGKDGVYIVKGENGLHQIMDSDRNDPLERNISVSYVTKAESIAGRDEIITQRIDKDKKDRSFYAFSGQDIRAGLVLTDNKTGKEYVVATKGEPFYANDDKEKKTPLVRLTLLRNRQRTNSSIIVSSLDGFSIKQKLEAQETGEVIDKDIFRLVRTNELSRIYPHRNTDDTDDAAQKRLDTLLKTTDPKELAAGISIRISENPKNDELKNVSGGRKTNPNLVQAKEKYKIQILYKGAPIGYLTNYDNLRFIADNGTIVPMSNLTLEQFRKIFDSQGKDPMAQMQEFKSNYNSSRAVFAALSKFVKPGQEVEITPEQVSQVTKFNVGTGEFDFVKKGVTFDQLPYNTIDGYYYIIDRSKRYGKGFTFKITEIPITNATGQARKDIEKQIAQVKAVRDTTAQLGRYIAVVKMPNGAIRFIELVTDPMSDDQLNSLITKLNERSAVTKEKNVETGENEKKEKIYVRKKIDYNEEINSEIASTLFISVPQQGIGTYITFALNDTGNLELTFHKKVGDKDIRRRIYVYGKTLADPAKFDSIDDMIKQINAAIEKHDKDYAKNESHKIGFTLTRENFKVSSPDTISISQITGNEVQLRTSVSQDVVKNVPLSVKAVSVEVVPPTPPQSSQPTAAQPASKNKELSEQERQALRDKIANMSGAPSGTAEQQQANPVSQNPALDQAMMELDSLKRDKELEAIKRRDDKIANGTRTAAAMIEANNEASALFNKKIKAAQDKINDIRNAGRNTALKITNAPVFDQGSVVNIDQFKKYINRILGDKVSVQEMEVLADRLKNGNITVGRFLTYLEVLQDGRSSVKGRIEVGANTGFKYHEAFHAVFRLMLNDNQIDKLLAYAKIEAGKKGINVKAEMQKMRELHTIYSEMSDKELEERFYEEYMADQFEDFKNNQSTSKTLPGIRGWFQKLWDFIKGLFNRGSRNELINFFREIDRGAYRNSKVRDNRFTKSDALSISEPVLKVIKIGEIDVLDENGMYVTIPKYLSQQEGDQLASTVASIYHMRVLNSTGTYNKKKLLEDIFADFLDLYNIEGPKKEFYYNEVETLHDQDPNLAQEYLNKLNQKYQVFYEEDNRKSLAEAVDIHLRVMGYQQELEDDEYVSMEDEFGSRVTTDNWKETHSIGGFGSLSKFLRQYIAATTFTVDNDEFGNTQFVNGEPLIQAVNANLVYNGVLKAVANITDQAQFVRRLQQLRDNNTETGKFLDKFFNDVDLEVNPVTGEFTVNNPKQATLFQMVIKGFQQYTVDYIFINKDIRKGKKISALMLANRMGEAKTQFTQWQNAYVQVFENEILRLKSSEEKKAFAKERTESLQDLLTYLDPGTYISDEDLHIESQRISNQLKEDLGISLSPLFIKFSIASKKKADIRTEAQRKLTESYSDVEGTTVESVKQIIKSIQALENPFAKNLDSLKEELIVLPGEEQDDQDAVDDLGEGGNVSRINDLAKGNAIFDETVSSTSYKNAEGELVYAHQLPTFHLVQVNALNNPETLNTISQDDFIAGNMLLESNEFRHLLGDLRVERIEGMKSSILNETEDGSLIEDKTISSNQNKGITYGSFSDREFIVSLLELYKYNKEVKAEKGTFYTSQHLIRVIEASNTGDTIGLPVIKAVETDADGKTKLTKEAVVMMAKEVAREFARIQTVNLEIKTGIYTDGEIEGYHYSVDSNGNRDAKKKPRGLKFYKMANALGKQLAEELEADALNPSFDINTKVAKINSRIQEYWGEQISQFVEKLDNLGVVTISKDENNNETIVNNLVDDFIVAGFESKGEENKNIPDEKKNDKLNLIPNSVRHNLSQILINDYLNTLSFNQLLYGDEAKAFKDDIDQVKRAKGANGSGASLESVVLAPELGITEQFTKSHILTFNDPKYKAKFAGGLKDKADAQSYTTTKGMRYTLFGLGQLTPQRAKILDKIENGEKLTPEEIFGENGLKAIEGMFNSYKLVYFDGPQYIKTSTVMLTKELTSMQVDGRWIARPGYEELHDLRERMERFESENSTVTFAAPKSASKGIKRNIFDSRSGFRHASDDNFVGQSTKYWRLQLVNPSNKIQITDPTQAKQIIIAEQDNSTQVNFMGSNTTIGELKNLYLKDTDQRIKNNYFRARNDIFDIEKGFEELGKSIQQDKITAKLEKFQQRAIETLRSSGADSQLLEFFSLDEETGKPKYNLNSTLTLEKYTQLFLAYFSKGVMSEKSPGHSVALMSNFGIKVVKVFTGRFDEEGNPIGEVVQRSVVEKDPKKYMKAKRWNNDLDRQFTDLKEGDIYVDDLRHNVPEYDKNGKIIGRYSEFMMPPHFMEDMNLKPGDRIPDHIAKMFGVRIPSQDKHSFISLKMVDFMPAYYGSTAVFPHELIEISGADFDIDKLYMHIAETYTRSGKRVAYGSAKTREGKFEEFVRWNSKNNRTFREELEKKKDTDPNYLSILKKIADLKRLEKDIDKAFNNIQKSDGSIRQGFVTAVVSARLVDSIRQKLTGIPELKEFSDQYGLTEDTYFVRDLQEMIAALDEKEERDFVLTMGTQWYNEFKSIATEMKDVETRLIQESLKEIGLPATEIELASSKTELNNGVLNNRILAQKLAFLNNEHVTKGGSNAIGFKVASVKALSDLLDPAATDNFLDLLSIGVNEDGNKIYPKGLGEVLLEGGSDTDSLLGKYKAYKNNKEGSRNIGPAVNSMLVYAILNNFNIKLRDTFIGSDGKPAKIFNFKLNGHVFSNYGNTRSYNSASGKYDSNQRIFSTISTLVSAMTDNTKERLAARLGLNIEAVGYVSNIVAQGVPLRSAVLLMLQPVVREYFEQTKIASNNIKTGAESLIFKSQVAKELLNKYQERAGQEYSKEDLTDDILVNNIKDNGSSATYQASVMEDFMGIINQSRYYSAVAGILKLTKGLGTSFEEYDAINEKIDMLGLRVRDNEKFERYLDPIYGQVPPFDLRQIMMGYDQNKPFHTYIQGYIKIADQISEISKGMFLERTAIFKRIEDIVKSNLNVRPSLRERFNTELKKDLISYLSIKAYRKFLAESGRTGTLSTMTNALLYDEAAVAKGEDFMDIVEIMRTIRQKLPNNYLANQFLNVISTSVVDAESKIALNSKNRDGINKLEANTWAKLSEYQIEKLRDAFVDIYQSEEDFDGKGRNGRDMANALFNYLIVKDGAQFRSGSFIRYIPNFIFTDFLNSTGRANDILKLSVNADNVEEMDEQYKKVFGITSLDLFNEFMENYVTHTGNSYYVRKMLIYNESKFEPTGNKVVDSFEPASLVETEKGISIDIFRGTRDKQQAISEMSLEEQAGITFMSDEDYIEYVTSLSEEEKEELKESRTKSRKFNDNEKGKFSKNMQSLRDKGFISNPSGQVLFPYIIKVSSGDMFKADKYYILKSVRKTKKSQDKNFDPKRLIQKGELVAQGIAAFYEPVQRKGAAKTFKGAAMFDPIPETAKLPRYRRPIGNTADFNPFYYTKSEDAVKEENWMLRHGFPVQQTAADAKVAAASKPVDTGSRSPKSILLEDYGITMKIEAGKGVTFEGDVIDMLKEKMTAKEFEKIVTPADLLRALGYVPSAAAPIVSTSTENSAESLKQAAAEGKPNVDLIRRMVESSQIFGSDSSPTSEKNPPVDPEEIKRRIEMMSRGQNPLNDECAGG